MRRSRARVIVGAAAAIALALDAASAFAADPWIARPLTQPAFGFAGDVGLGVGQSTAISPLPQYDTPVGTRQPGAGLNVEAAIGLPLGFEVGLRAGVRFGPNGALTNADAYGRLFDPLSLTVDSGTQSFANPELRVAKSFFDVPTAALGLEVRAMPVLADGSLFVLTPGVPLRLRSPHTLRIDTGVYAPITGTEEQTWGVEVPVSIWFQHDAFFWGLLTGIFWNNPAYGARSSEGVPSDVEAHAGLGAGYTIAGLFDLEAQVLTTRIDGSWARYIGGGLGVGVVTP